MIAVAATFSWQESNGASETVSTPTNLNFGSTDATDLTPLSYPITAGNNSYEKYVRAKFTGTFSKIDNIQFWKSAGAYVTGESIKWSGTTTSYTQPTASTSSVATASVPTSDPGTANVSIGGSLSGSITTSGGMTDYIVLQLQTTTSTPAGAVNTKTFTLTYDEV